MFERSLESPICPIPLNDYPQVLMAHGGGGRLMGQLIERIFGAAFDLPSAADRHDSALLSLAGCSTNRLAFTTDSFVVRPLFFPGGDIGSLAVNGTVNDLAMSGARPLALSAGFILEEGLAIEQLWRIACSMRAAADSAGVRVVTGDTKVVDRGKGDGVYINTSGIGIFDHDLTICPASIRAGDAILLSGDIGRHGVAIMAQREGLEFETAIVSDCASLTSAVQNLLAAGITVHCLRDLTRGGMASALVEIADASQIEIHITEELIPINQEVAAACEILGLDPLYVANEGCFVAFVPQEEAALALRVLKGNPVTAGARQIGLVTTPTDPVVILKTTLGAERIIDLLSGEQLPRIC